MEKTEKALVTILETGNKVVESLADDGKINFGEGISIAYEGMGLIKVFRDLPEIKEELKNLDQAKVSHLVEVFKDKFDLKNDEAEQKVEQGIEVLAQLAVMVFDKNAE
jgi:hypothetical protein